MQIPPVSILICTSCKSVQTKPVICLHTWNEMQNKVCMVIFTSVDNRHNLQLLLKRLMTLFNTAVMIHDPCFISVHEHDMTASASCPHTAKCGHSMHLHACLSLLRSLHLPGKCKLASRLLASCCILVRHDPFCSYSEIGPPPPQPTCP